MPDVTLEQLAKAAGVAKSTVSMALRNHPHIAKKTRARIQRLAQELGYRPNPSISALMAHIRNSKPIRSHDVIAFVAGFPDLDAMLAHPEHREAYEGARDRAESLGFRMDFFSLTAPGMTHRRLNDVLLNRGIRTLVFGPQGHTRQRVAFAWEHFSSSMIGYLPIEPAHHRAVPNSYTDMHLAIKRLLQAGYRRIGAVMDWEFDIDADNQLSAAYLAFQYRHPPKWQIPLLLIEETDDYRDAFLAWFEAQRPAAVIAQDTRVAGWLEDAGHRIPDDVAVASLSLKADEPYFSGICPHWYHVGGAAVDLAVAAAQRNETGAPDRPKLSLVYGFWIPGKTHISDESGRGIPGGGGYYNYMTRGRAEVHVEDDRG